MSEKSEKSERKELLDDVPPVVPSGMSVASMRDADVIMVSFYWSPPEDKSRRYTLYRAAISPGMAKSLIQGLSKTLEKKAIVAQASVTAESKPKTETK